MKGFDKPGPLNPLPFFTGSEGYLDISGLKYLLKGFLKEKREEIKQLHRLGSKGSEVTSLHSEVIDSIIISLFNFFSRIHKYKLLENPPLPADNPLIPNDESSLSHFTKGGVGGITEKDGKRRYRGVEPLAVIALGGYGRGELSPYSDIDIMFLYPEAIDPYTEALSHDILYVLWDLNLDVGHSVRSFKDCIDIAEKDIRVKTSLLEARYLCGKREIYDIFRKDIIEKIFFRKVKVSSFVREKLKEARRRHIHYGSSPYLLEPHLKEGEGGLRDISSSLIKRAFKNQWKAPGQIKKIGGPFILSNGQIGIIISRKDPNPLPQNPRLLMEVFYLSQMYGASLSECIRELLRESINLINSDFRSSKEINGLFISILNSNSRIYETLKNMHEMGILDRYIPEFGRLSGLVLYDLYHKYTVDEHTLLAVRNLEALRNTKYKRLERISDILDSLKRPWILFMALLLHDIGKASGKEHIKAAGERINSVLNRLGLKEQEERRVSLLVRNHLLMSLISQRRELSDQRVIKSFASEVVDEENLKMLYLISYADISAVRPGFWTDWKAALIEIFCRDRVGLLYQITRTLYEKGIDISSAKINTEAGRVTDIFYVTDSNRKKITGDEQGREIKEALTSVVSS